ncbi:hypothetical protein IFM89_035952, partial [Coptis chinensis]
MKARITRMWIARNERNPETIYGLEMLMIDEKENQMKASIPAYNIDQFKDKLNEGDIFVFEKFIVASTYGTYRQIDNNLTIKFKDDTVVTATTDDNDGLFSKNKFTFTDLEHIPSRHGKVTCTIDVIGFLKGISPQGSKKYIEITIVNERGTELNTALWDDLSKQILSSMSGKEDVVIILSSMFVKKFEVNKRDVFKLSPKSATRIYLNLDMKCVEELRNRSGIQSIQVQIEEPHYKEINTMDTLQNENKTTEQLKILAKIYTNR